MRDLVCAGLQDSVRNAIWSLRFVGLEFLKQLGDSSRGDGELLNRGSGWSVEGWEACRGKLGEDRLELLQE